MAKVPTKQASESKTEELPDSLLEKVAGGGQRGTSVGDIVQPGRTDNK
ncbi:hypothetical protein [Devosia soli]|nr:hypothetical protein [Devosia soli]